MQKPIRELNSTLQTLPSEDDDSIPEEEFQRIESLMDAITRPVTTEEAEALIPLLGDDTCYGLAWTLLHIIETAPAYAIDKRLKDREMVALLKDRREGS